MKIDSNAKNNIKAVFTPDELADHLAISKATVYRMVSKRKIPFVKVSGMLRFKIKDVEDFFESERIGPIKM